MWLHYDTMLHTCNHWLMCTHFDLMRCCCRQQPGLTTGEEDADELAQAAPSRVSDQGLNTAFIV